MKNLFKQIILLILFFNQTLFADLEKVSLQLEWKHQFEFAGFYAAIEKGYYKDIGLEVEREEMMEEKHYSQNLKSKLLLI
jgi:polar amino acid transport system substrate-binding protein